ncbi:MAG: RNA-binding S4 domain-containing protein [Actinobacteria bacterium]|nr:RNA-binding S4 domain-containing protein [Actinomycetota bacterium]
MRVDKFLKVSRLIKRRTLAKEVGDRGWILINGRTAKPGDRIVVGDVLQLNFGRHLLKVRVLELRESVRAEEAGQLYEILEDLVQAEGEGSA